MLLVVGRLEDAGLDQRRLPSALLPSNSLATSRCATGPDPDAALSAPPVDADERVRRFWAGTEAALPHDGTTIDALREGVHLLDEANLPVNEESSLLLVALVAHDDDVVGGDTAVRARAWALGVSAVSPLIEPVSS